MFNVKEGVHHVDNKQHLELDRIIVVRVIVD
jgi:hypothetical protein